MSSIVTEVQEQIQEIARPLHARLLAVLDEIQLREQELEELRQVRAQLLKVIKGIAPELLPEPEKPKKRNTNDWTPKADKVQAFHEFLLANRSYLNGNGFHAAGLTAQFKHELPIAYSSVHKALNALHDQGVIRLDSTGTGGAKFYKLVDA